MRTRLCLALLLLGVWSTVTPSRAEESAATNPETSITIYANPMLSSRDAQGRAIVQQRRRIDLPEGEGRIELSDVPAQLNLDSVLLRPVGEGGAFDVTEQSFQNTGGDPDSILRQYVGRDILVNRRQSGPGEQARLTETINARLLAFDDKVIVLHTTNRQLPIQIIPRDRDITEIKLTQATTMPVTRPTLSLQVASEKAGPRDVDVIYETRGFGWDAGYTLLLEDAGKPATLEAWVDITNRSGAGFADAAVSLVAGSGRDLSKAHRYALPRHVALPDEATRRVALLDRAKRVKLATVNVFAAHQWKDVAECLSLSNTKENQLGSPLPPGRVRVVRLTDSAPPALVAETNVPATAPDAAMTVRVGDALGLSATREHAELRETGSGARRTTSVKITLANRRKEAARVIVMEQIQEDASRVVQNSHPFEKGAADTITFALELPPGEVTSLTYTVAAEGA